MGKCPVSVTCNWVYTQSHIDYVIETFKEVKEEREQATGFRITYEPPFLRHFTARFEPLGEVI